MRAIGYFAAALVALVLATSPIIAMKLPDYLPSHLAQAVAVAVLVAYFYRFDLLTRYRDRISRGLLLLAFAIPLDNLLAMKVIRKVLMDSHVALQFFRPAILLLLAITIGTILARRIPRLPLLLIASAVFGIVSWIISSLASADAPHALASGFFEIIAPFIVVYVYAANADRDLLKHSLFLFCLGFAIVALSQSASILTGGACCALTAQGFLAGKLRLELMTAAGGNGYGNTTNFISLLVLVLPFVAGSLYFSKTHQGIKAGLLFLLLYSGLLVYSRGGILSLLFGLLVIAVAFFLTARQIRWAIPFAIAAVVLVHIPSGGFTYYISGLTSFAGQPIEEKTAPPPAVRAAPAEPQIAAPPVTDREKIATQSAEIILNDIRPDNSGLSRSNAIATGLQIARAHLFSGIGTGMYIRTEREFTSPHSMLILRLAENGILGLISILLLFAFAPIQIARQRSNLSPLALSAAISATCFASYASAFGAAFSDGGLIPWGFGFGLSLCALINDGKDNTLVHYPECVSISLPRRCGSAG